MHRVSTEPVTVDPPSREFKLVVIVHSNVFIEKKNKKAKTRIGPTHISLLTMTQGFLMRWRARDERLYANGNERAAWRTAARLRKPCNEIEKQKDISQKFQTAWKKHSFLIVSKTKIVWNGSLKNH